LQLLFYFVFSQVANSILDPKTRTIPFPSDPALATATLYLLESFFIRLVSKIMY
jgi:hypothetical protein